jgi:hypothetical protein
MRRVLLCGFLAACSTGGESAPTATGEWTYAVAMADCAPWDGMATTVFLTRAPYGDDLPLPHLRLSVYHGVDEVAGKRWDVGLEHDREGVPTFCPADGPCVPARDGWIEFDPRTGEGPLAGRYDLMLDNGRREAGSFSAQVLERLALCG